jgi:lactobin A/cerein 7B family class IIb bacteriocin
MRNLDLNAYSVSEMNVAEMQQTDGGLAPFIWLLIGLAISEMLDPNAPDDFRRGWNSVNDD